MIDTKTNINLYKMAGKENEEIIPLFLDNEMNHSELEDNETMHGTIIQPKLEKTISRSQKFGGFCLALLASSIFTFNGILVQYYKLNSVDTVTVRSVFQILVLGAILTYKGSYQKYRTSKCSYTLKYTNKNFESGLIFSLQDSH